MNLRRPFIFVALLALALPAPAQESKSRLANAIAAIVNDAVITYADISKLIAPAVSVLIGQYGDRPQVLDEKVAELRQSATEELVIRQLILHDFKTGGYNNFPESLIEDEIKDRIRERFVTRSKLTETLQADGMTTESFRQQIRDDFIVSVLRNQKVSGNTIISPAKIENYYAVNRDKYQQTEQVKLRLITVNENPGVPGAAKKLLEEIRGKVAAGASFGEMAALYSEDSYKTQGGDRGWIERKDLREELTEAAFKLKSGELSAIIETPQASYLMFCEAKKLAQPKSLGEVREEVERTLIQQERKRQQDQYVARLRAKSFVRYF